MHVKKNKLDTQYLQISIDVQYVEVQKCNLISKFHKRAVKEVFFFITKTTTKLCASWDLVFSNLNKFPLLHVKVKIIPTK